MRSTSITLLLCCFAAFSSFAAAPSLVQGDWLCEGLGCGFVADINGDGLDDLFDSWDRKIRYNLGGAFGDPMSITGIADNETVVAAEDYNGDGFVDVVLWPNRGPHDEGPNRMAYGNGSGGFTNGFFPTQYGGLGQQPPRDFNDDGKVDLVLAKMQVSTENPNDVWTTLSLLRGNGDGTFVLDQQLRFLSSAYPFMAFADFNGDGHYDLIRDGNDREVLYIHLSDKKGRLGQPRERFMGVRLGRVQAGDINGDSLPDVVVESSPLGGKAMHVLFNDGRGKFTSFAEMISIGSAWGPLVADIYPGGGDEITLPHANGHLVVYSGAGNVLRPVASTQIGGTYYHAKLIRFSSPTSSEFVVTDRVFNVVPNTNRSKIVFIDGELPEVAAVRPGPRRTRAMSRAGAVTNYSAIVTGACAPAALNEFAFAREGMFFDFEPREDGTVIRAAMVNGKLFTRVQIGERMLTGDLALTDNNKIRGYLYDRTTNPCGDTGRVLVDAVRVQH